MMRRRILMHIVCVVSVIVVYTVHTFLTLKNVDTAAQAALDLLAQNPPTTGSIQETIPLTLVFCRNTADLVHLDTRDTRLTWQRQKEQFLVTLSSMLYFSKLPLVRIVLFTDSLETYVELLSSLDKWPASQRGRLRFEMHDIEIERFHGGQILQWRPCAWSKMYIPDMMLEVDAAIYLDSDVLFLGPVEDLWPVFGNMSDKSVLAAAPEVWYLQDGRTRPTAGKYGINTGVLFMNLTRLREAQLSKRLLKYKDIVPAPRHDQDVLNAFLKDHPRLLHEVSARFNFLPSTCHRSAPLCEDCLEKGILVLHGADSTFFKLVDAKMQAVYRVLQAASLDLSPPLEAIVERLENALGKLRVPSHRYVYMCQHLPGYDLQLLRHVRSLVLSTDTSS